MSLVVSAVTLAGIALLTIILLIVTIARQRKFATEDRDLIGSVALVTEPLEPTGTVMVRGELWRACSRNGMLVSARCEVRVVGFRNHLLVVEPTG